MIPKIKWKVQPLPTGRYRSFKNRGWPQAYYDDGQETPCAWLECADDYAPRKAAMGEHAELKLVVADHNHKPWKRVVVKERFATLKDAKEGLTKVLAAIPNLQLGWAQEEAGK